MSERIKQLIIFHVYINLHSGLVTTTSTVTGSYTLICLILFFQRRIFIKLGHLIVKHISLQNLILAHPNLESAEA